MKNKGMIWILVLLMSASLVYVWLLLYQSSFEDFASKGGPEDLWQETVATPVAMPPAVDGISGATPRIITFRTKGVVESIKPVVVGISAGAAGRNPAWNQGMGRPTPAAPSSIGSGIIVHASGYVLTNFHVVAIGEPITVSLFSPGGVVHLPATLVLSDRDKDMALLKIDAPGPLPSAPLGDSDKVKVGDQVLGVGNPFGLSQTVTKGIVSARRKALTVGRSRMRDLIQTDVPINPGNSGGALCNLNGEVIGINTAIYSPLENVYTGVSFAIPIKQAIALFGDYMDLTIRPVDFRLVASQEVSSARPYWQPLAAATAPPEPLRDPANPERIGGAKRIMPSPGEGIEEIAWLGIDLVPENNGVAVDEVEGISPMEAGLQAGDIVKEINGYKTPDIYALKDAIKTVRLRKGEGIVIRVFRPATGRHSYINFRLQDYDIMGR